MFIDNLNPIIYQNSLISLRWYGLFLAIGVLLSIFIYKKLFAHDKDSLNRVLDLSIWLVIGGLIGARLGHIVFYNLDYFLAHPKEIIMINHGGLASHGMTIGLLVTVLLYQKIKKIELREYLDLLVIPIPLLAAFIRLGNFFNSEIVGNVTDVPWGFYFPHFDGSTLILRHPSQLYESLTALIIFIILIFVYKKYKEKIPQYFIFNLFLLLYFSTRFLLEFFKERHILNGVLSMGQWLSIPFVLWSVYWFVLHTMKHMPNKK